MGAIGSPGTVDPALTVAARVDSGQEADRRVRLPLLRWTYGLINRLVMAGDVFIILLSSLLPLVGRDFGMHPMPGIQAVLLAVLEAAVFLVILNRTTSYRFETYQRLSVSIPSLVPGLVSAWLVSALYFYAFQASDMLITDLFWYWHGPEVIGLVLARVAAKSLTRTVIRRGLIRRTVVLIGANPAGEAILAQLLSPPQRAQYEVVRVFADAFDHRQTGNLLGVPIASDMNMLGVYAQTNVIDLVIVALPLARAIKSVAMIEELHWIAADVVIPVEEIGLSPSFARLANIAGVSTLQVLHRPLKGSQALIKIAEDYIIGALALILTGPLMLLVALAIRLDSNGPALFRQERTGFNTNSFWIYKFRTMTVDPNDDGSLGTMSADNPRITRVGRFLRRLSIDELPQLLNVMRGDMSIVGPRPYVPNMLVGSATFREAVRNCAYRYRLKPGITGLAQSSGMRSNALRSMDNAERSVEMDLQYIMNWSLWLDFKIMLRTVLVAMSGPDVF